MAKATRIFCLLWLLISFANSLPAKTQSFAKPPAEDEFYQNPPGYESAALGSILRYRRTPNPITLDNKSPLNLKDSWQLLYRTQDSTGLPEATVVTILVPHNAKPGHLFHHASFSDSAYNGCSPSITMQTGARPDDTYGQLQLTLPISALNQGWYVSIADDNGPQAAYMAGLQQAHATLDSIRAVKQSGNITGIDPNPLITMYGYSGGAVSIGFASEIQPSYAPDLNITAAAVGGLMPDLPTTWASQQVSWSMFTPAALLGLAHDYSNFSKWLDDNLVPATANEFRKGERQCYISNRDIFSNQDMGLYLKHGYKSLFEDEVPASVIKYAGLLGIRGTPRMPWYLFQSVGDDASPIALTDLVYDKYCKNGANIYFERNQMNLSHSAECVAGAPGAFEWLTDRHNGIPVKLGCETVARSQESVRAFRDGTFLRGYLLPVLAYLGAPVGSRSLLDFWGLGGR